MLTILEALRRYILSCSQHPDGGLRDKPPMRSDFYHTLYTLSGLSASLYHYVYHPKSESKTDPAFGWDCTVGEEEEKKAGVGRVHPVFVLPWGDAERLKRWSSEQTLKKGKVA
jgi:protein farnesyltransferase subunit beta